MRGKETGISITQINGPQKNCIEKSRHLSYVILKAGAFYMRKKGHKLRDGKKLWFSKYSSWTRGQGSASPGN